MSVEGIAREVNKYAGWAWNKFPGLPHKEYEKVKNFHKFDKFGALLNHQWTGPLHVQVMELSLEWNDD